MAEAEGMDSSPWRKFKKRPPIPGFLENCIVVLQDERTLLEQRKGSLSIDQVDTGLFDWEQLNLAVEICRYLSNNGVKNYQLCCNFQKTLLTMEKKLKQHENRPDLPVNLDVSKKTHPTWEADVVDVTVLLLLNAYGPDHEERILELLQQAIISSRCGVIILGNVAMYNGTMNGDLKRLLADMKNLFAPENYFPIHCKKHRIVNPKIYNAFDLSQASPLGGCKLFCEGLPCGHPCPFPCHPEDPHHVSKKYWCRNHCERKTPCGHQCLKLCREKCECHVPVAVYFPCGHYQRTIVPCHKKSEARCDILVKRRLLCGHFLIMPCSENPATKKCELVFTFVLPSCGHSVTYKCFESNQIFKCTRNRVLNLSCGHQITVPCKDYTKEYINKARCNQKCMRLLDCGHICREDCHPEDPDHQVIKCKYLCRRRCPRGIHQCGRQHPCYEPCEPCIGRYEYRLICGHAVSIQCSEPDINENDYTCSQKCIRIRPFCRHPCSKTCSEDCGDCEVIVPKLVKKCPRDHYALMKCGEEPSELCVVWVASPATSECGHPVLVPCHKAETLTPSQVTAYCTALCHTTFLGEGECGHRCVGDCKKCYQGRFHMRCEEPCNKTLICGHQCVTPCTMICSPCPLKCFNSCEHKQCEHDCGVPCEITCEEPCTYQCEHSACSKKCWEVCDKKLCCEPCKLLLKCGHPCIGFCGEMCPPYCKVCDPERVLDDPFYQRSEPNPASRFFYLPDCGHCLDSETMDKCMTVDSSDEIQPKRCPICHARITKFRRYSAILHENRQLIDSIRRRFFGDANAIKMSKDKTEELIQHYAEEVEQSEVDLFFPEFPSYIWDELDDSKHKRVGEVSVIFLDKARYLEWLTTEWITAERTIRLFIRSVPKRYLQRFSDYWMDTIYMVTRRCWPLHPNEMKAYQVERQRLDDAINLYKRFDNSAPTQLIYTKEGMKRFLDAQAILFALCPYTNARRDQFLGKLQELDGTLNYTIKLTHEEREQVVAAFGTRSGRWFKCKNGHPYVITECGGAMQISQCSECGVVIGGDQHILEPNNYLATEMDGADEPMWPTTFDRAFP